MVRKNTGPCCGMTLWLVEKNESQMGINCFQDWISDLDNCVFSTLNKLNKRRKGAKA